MLSHDCLHVIREGKLNKLEARKKFLQEVLKSKYLEKY